MSDTFYAAVNETDTIPAQYEWNVSLDGAKDDAIEEAASSGDMHVIYEITVRELYRTRITVELERS